ncbi:MAG: hypothetical protein CFE24_08405 [Flavobacterium sp. BFFFF2]|nr:MAG: hypothetical protein CFE24_08405 [Flavobacterium sp. BFFFF2]
MNTIAQIENALKAINQATFQILINHLLHLQGNKFISAPGAVVGKEKTSKGTPDSFFIIDEKYIFVECTTQERLGKSKTFFEKLSKDVDHCFKEKVTTIERNKIEKIILACNEKISIEEFNQLNDKVKCFNADTKFEIFNIQNLSMLIFDFPKLADEYLNIQMVKGDIYTLDQFLLKTENGLQPSLTNKFIGREDEIKNCIATLKTHNILLLSGGAGVGKSKLAVKILEEFSKDDYFPIVIQSSGVSLWDDYQHLFTPGKQHIILFDDANKSINNLNYLLSKLEDSKSYSVRLIITSRDYVKKQVSVCLSNYLYKEINIPEFKDEETGIIIVNALPNLKYHSEIKRKIVELAKGNARVALMATYSVTPDSETNYLSSPVLLYEKYFKKISEEIGVFNNPIILKSLAIVSFFGVVDRNNGELQNALSIKFGIDWNELWSAIIELHNSEILDVYLNEIVKVSDQVLATYAFYKCFIDEQSALINYAEWITSFMEKFSKRIRITLVDVNNTFVYHHVKDLVLPHLNEVTRQINSDDELYAFYNLFWFYKGRDCLLYLKKWIESLPQEEQNEILTFSYVHNNHTRASKYFELLEGFWNHPNELLKPSIELALTLLNKQPSRLPEILKFFHEDFKYKLEDIEHGYIRQNMLLDILLGENLSDNEKSFANGIFLNLSATMFGWHYSQVTSAKGNAYTIYNFDLYKSVELTKLRERNLNQVYHLFDPENKQIQKILNQIIYTDGDIDKSIYLDELHLYEKIISEKLDRQQYSHCKFVSVLAEHLVEAGYEYPEYWSTFIESDIRKLSKFLKPSWEYNEGKSFEESEKEKIEEFDDFVRINDWESLEKFLLNIDDLYKQRKDNNDWDLGSAVTDIYISIARKNKFEFENALRLFFSGKVLFPLRLTVINVALLENILTGHELLNIISDYEHNERSYWEFVSLTMLPKEQIDESSLELLLNIFKSADDYIYIHRMLDYVKYEAVFDSYKEKNSKLEDHNIITYITSIILNKARKTRRNFGFHFCTECASFFNNHPQLLKNAYWVQHEIDSHFDYDGKELKAILDIDRNFINDSLKNDAIGLDYPSKIRLENVNTDCLWDCPEYDELIEDLLLTILDRDEYILFIEDDISSLFRFKSTDEKRAEKVKALIIKLTQKHSNNGKLLLLLIEVVYSSSRDWFLEYFKEFLLVIKDIEITKQISFGKSSSTIGSWVPVFQKEIEFYQDILRMISILPNILDYSEHLDYFEQRIIWKKNDIVREQKRDFMQEFY